MIKKLEQLNEPVWINETLCKCSSNGNENRKYGIYDYNMKVILPVIFDEIEMSSDKQIIGKIGSKFYYFKVKFENNITKTEVISAFYIDINGNITESDIEEKFCKGINMTTENKQANEIIENAKGIIEVAKARAEKMVSESYLLKQFQNQADKMRQEIYKDHEKLKEASNELLLTKYNQTKKLTDNRWCVQKEKNGKLGIIDGYNKTILPAEYDCIELLDGIYILFFVKKGNFAGLCDLEGFTIIEPDKYVDLVPQKKGLFYVKCNSGESYYININNKRIEEEVENK